jgi:hypothetical protein
MITNRAVSDELILRCRRPAVPKDLGSLSIMQVDLENYSGQARPGDPIQNGEAPILRLFGVTDNVCSLAQLHISFLRGTRSCVMYMASMHIFSVPNPTLPSIANDFSSD